MRLWRVIVAGVAVPVAALLVITLVVTVYAFTLAFEVRGAPDPARITRFAESLSRSSWNPFTILLTLPAAAWAARRTRQRTALSGAAVGAISGIASTAVGFHVSLGALLGFLLTVAAGSLGAMLPRPVSGKDLHRKGSGP